jgi:hypothetical protein
MGRITFRLARVASVTLLLMAFGTAVRGFAQEAEQEKKPATHELSEKEKTYTWKKVADGIWEAHIARFPHDRKEKDKPEFAVLRLSAEKYKEFQKDRKEFLNKYGILKAKVKKQELFTPPPPQEEDPDPDVYYLVLSHWPGSAVAAVTYSGGGQPK